MQYYSGNVRYSTNGTSWITVGTLPQSKYARMTYHNGIFYALCTDGTMFYCNTSPTLTANWMYLDGASAATSSLCTKSGKSNWCGICYGNGKLVAVCDDGSVAVLEDTTPGTIQFTNIGDSTTFTIKDEKTFTIPASSVSSTSGGEYYVEFNVSNLKLISAEVTNLNYNYVNPIKASYNEVEMIGPGGSSQNISWGTRSTTVSHGYIYQTSGQSSCSSNFYVTNSGLTSYNSTYGWYPSDSYRNTQTSVTIYSDTNDSMTLYCSSYTPSVITGYSTNTGSVTFYSTNGVSQNLGTYSFTSSRSFTFDGYSSVSSSSYSPGPNFGSNYGINKINYSLSNATLTATLGNQLLRYSSDGKDPGLAMWRSGSTMSGYTSNYDDDWAILCMGVVDGNFYYSMSPTGSSDSYVYYSYTTVTDSRSISSDYYGNPIPGGYSSLSDGSYYKTMSFPTCNGTNYWGAGYPIIVHVKDPPAYCYIYRFFVQQYYSGCPGWGGMNRSDSEVENNQCVTADESYIKFNGNATCTVTVTPTQSPIYASYNTPYVTINGSKNTQSTSHGSNYSYTIPASAFRDASSQRYYTTIYLYNASMRYIYQPNGTISYPSLLANSNYSVTYSYNNYSGSRVVTTGTTSSYDSSLGKYYIQLPRNSTPKFAARKYSVTETIYDMIDFTANTMGNKNGCLSSNFSDNYSSAPAVFAVSRREWNRFYNSSACGIQRAALCGQHL